MAEDRSDQRRERTSSDTQQIWDTDTEIGSFENIVLHLISDVTDTHSLTDKFIINHQFRPAGKLVRSISEASLSTKVGCEMVCRNCQQGKINSGNIREMVKLQEQLACSMRMLKKKTVDYNDLLQENQNLRKSLDAGEAGQRSLLSMVWGYSPASRRRSIHPTNQKDDEIASPTRQVSGYEVELRNRNQELRDQIEQFKKQRQTLKQNFSKKTEIQKEILEEVSGKCKKLEDQVEVERQLRVKREAEVARLHNHLLQKENNFNNEMSYKDEYIKRIKSEHSLELEKCFREIKQKDEEVLLTKQRYESLIQTCQTNEFSSSHDKSAVGRGRVDNIIIQNLEQDLQLKMRQLNDSNLVIQTLEEDVKAKQQEVDAIVFSRSVKSDKEQLENFKVHLIELINNLEVESFSKHSQNAPQQSTSENGEMFNNPLVNPRFGDKEEAD